MPKLNELEALLSDAALRKQASQTGEETPIPYVPFPAPFSPAYLRQS